MDRRPWRLVLASLAFAAAAPPSLLGLPLAGLILAARPRAPAQWATALLVGVSSAALLVAGGHDLVTGVLRAYVVLVSAAFVVLSVVAPARFLRQALRASALALAGVAGLARAILGPEAGGLFQWDATREASATLRTLIETRPEAYAVFEPVVRFLGETMPAMLVLQALAGLALAWQWHQRLGPRPLGEPLAPFREFRFADAWVWGMVGAIAVWITPLFAGLRTAALNVLVVLIAFYLLRGAAIAVAFAGVAGLSPAVLVGSLVISAALALPLLFILPGLATLGVSDTWLEFRRRLVRRPNVS
jgi:hypothetical protein